VLLRPGLPPVVYPDVQEGIAAYQALALTLPRTDTVAEASPA
jgi:hypothetical protein